MSESINTHKNANGEKYYSKTDENGEIIYSFSPDFEDIWSQEDEDLYGAPKTIKITTEHAASSYGIPVCLVDGCLVDDADGLRACMKELGWSRAQAAEHTGKSVASIDQYLYGKIPVPAEVWNLLRDRLAAS